MTPAGLRDLLQFCDRGIGSESDSAGKFEFVQYKSLNGFHETGKIVLVKISQARESIFISSIEARSTMGASSRIRS